jgi:hypothetical protein
MNDVEPGIETQTSGLENEEVDAVGVGRGDREAEG